MRGLTTAAGLWVTAAIGVLCGTGLFFLAAVATIATAVILAGLKVVEVRYLASGQDSQVSIEPDDSPLSGSAFQPFLEH